MILNQIHRDIDYNGKDQTGQQRREQTEDFYNAEYNRFYIAYAQKNEATGGKSKQELVGRSDFGEVFFHLYFPFRLIAKNMIKTPHNRSTFIYMVNII